MWLTMLLAQNPKRITMPASANRNLGPILSRILPKNGDANPPTIPEAENIAAVIVALPPKLCFRAGKNTGWLFLTPPSTNKLLNINPSITQPYLGFDSF